MWSALRHPNVLPLLGVTMTSSRFTMMSEWMVNGNANDYVKACPDADRYGIVGVCLRSPHSNLSQLIDAYITPGS